MLARQAHVVAELPEVVGLTAGRARRQRAELARAGGQRRVLRRRHTQVLGDVDVVAFVHLDFLHVTVHNGQKGRVEDHHLGHGELRESQ